MLGPAARHWIVSATSLLFALSIVGVPVIANADTWGSQSTTTGAHPDGGSHWYCFGSGFPSQKFVSVNEISEVALDSATDANVQLDDACNYSSGVQTDVRWLSGNLASIRGQAPCVVYLASGYCDRYDVTIDFIEIAEGEDDEIDGRKTICHELGHSVGLTHHDSGYKCMITGPVPSTDGQWRRYEDHHIAHINAWF